MQQFEEVKMIASKDYVYCLYRYKSVIVDYDDGKEIKSETNFWFVSRMKILYGPIHITKCEWLTNDLHWVDIEHNAHAFHEARYGLLEKFLLQSIDLKEGNV